MLWICTPATQKCRNKQEQVNIYVGEVFLDSVCLCVHQYIRQKIDKRYTNKCICPD